MGKPENLATAASALRQAHVSCDHPAPVQELRAALGQGDFALILLFVSPMADFQAIVSEAQTCFSGAHIVACTTAGEISEKGYTEGEIVAAALPADLFAVTTLVLPDLGNIVPQQVFGDLIRARAALAQAAESMPHEFAFLAVDGMSLREDELMSALSPGLGAMPLFGGSAGDGVRFEQAFVACNGKSYRDAAVLTLVRSHCRVKVFSLDHLVPSTTRMVVTSADPSRRLVHEINAEPAAREYARLLGKDPEQLDTFTFAAHPVVVKVGGRHHVRAIQRVVDKTDLVFFSAIDEGLVLTLANPEDLATHLDRELTAMAESGPLEGILVCDCILRRVEAQQSQQTARISEILRRNRVVGFGTYGEQCDAKHVNQTMTGVAIYRPDPEPEPQD